MSNIKSEKTSILLWLPDNLKRKLRYKAGQNMRSVTEEINIILSDATKEIKIPRL